MPANDTQIGGDHYKGATCPHCGTSIEHWDLAWLFRWDNFQYAITKYVMRWRSKHGVEDLRKAQHCLEKYIEVILRDEAKLETNERDEDGTRLELTVNYERPSTFRTTADGVSYTRPSPDLDESGEPGPGYANQDPDLPLAGPRWPTREPGETPEEGDPVR